MLLTTFLILAFVIFWMLTAGWDRIWGLENPAAQPPTTLEQETMNELDNLEREARAAFAYCYAHVRAVLAGRTDVAENAKHPMAVKAAEDAKAAFMVAHAPQPEPAAETATK